MKVLLVKEEKVDVIKEYIRKRIKKGTKQRESRF